MLLMDVVDAGLSLVALIVLEIILGIDNLVFLSILTERLPLAQRKRARRWGLSFAWVTRLLLLALAYYLTKLSQPFFVWGEFEVSVRDLFLFVGGGFLITKATQEIHQEVGEFDLNPFSPTEKKASFHWVVIQVGLMDIIFSLDSVMTAVGLSSHFFIMALAITCAIIVMIYASEAVSYFIDKHPTLKMLALSFLILIGMVLVADSFKFHIPRGYVYFAMAFSLSVEGLNYLKRNRLQKKKKNVNH